MRARMRATRIPAVVLLAGAVLSGAAGAAAADEPSATPSTGDNDAGPTEAGTTFRTAAAVEQGRRATAGASTGDYLYWVFPADAGQRATVKATVTLPESATRHGASTWQIDVYDGLRRRQACMYGRQTKAAPTQAASVELSCALRTVRGWAEPWANDPLPGSYYVRLTVTDLPETDLGLPIQVAVEATTVDTGGAYAVDGSLSAPLVPGATAGKQQDGGSASQARQAADGTPEDGWFSGWWSDRWLWTAGGGVLGTLAGIAGYSLARGRGRAARVPPGS